MDALLLEHLEALAVAVTGDHPVDAVSSQPPLGGIGVHAHAGQAAGGGGAHRVGLVDLPRVVPPEHGDGQRRHVAERGHGVAGGGVDVGQEVIEAVR
jgi:hypothetical protein